MRPCAFLPSSDRRRAVTLVELLVGMAIGAVVFGILLNTFDQTQRLASREVRRNSERQEALLALHRISGILADAVPAGSVDVPLLIPETFEPQRLRVISWRGANGQSLLEHEIASISTAASAEEAGLQFVQFDAAGHGGRAHRPQARLVAEFAYTTLEDPGVWHSSLEHGQFPALVRVRLAANNPDLDSPPYILTTVIATAVGGDR